LTGQKSAIGRHPPRFPELPGATTPLELNNALLNHFFPGSPTNNHHTILLPCKDIPALYSSEVERALARPAPSSAPRPDMTPNSDWKRIHNMALNLILDLLAPLLSHGFHPPSLKKADGIVLDKAGKPSCDLLSTFRLIVLVKRFPKILERIMNGCLPCVAHVAGVITPHQCGSITRLSVADACNTLTLEIRTLQIDKSKVSTLFLDIKEGFDNVNPSSLWSILKSKGVNPSLVPWTGSFLTGGSCRPVFQGFPKVFTPVSVGTPQGSSVSALLLVIYVSRLH